MRPILKRESRAIMGVPEVHVFVMRSMFRGSKGSLALKQADACFGVQVVKRRLVPPEQLESTFIAAQFGASGDRPRKCCHRQRRQGAAVTDRIA